MNSLERFSAALKGLEVDRPPVWMMRQAGRTLPEYLEVREKHSFLEVCRTPELAAEVTLQPLRRFPVDAAIIFSDILVVPEAMGIKVEFLPAPRLTPQVSTDSEIDALVIPEVNSSLGYVADAIREVRKSVGQTHAVLGFSGAPFTLACYMIDGMGSKGFIKTMTMMYARPDLLHRLLRKLTDAVKAYLAMQVEAGVTAFQLFDTWAGELAPEEYADFALPYAREIFESLRPLGTPSIYYAKGVSPFLDLAGTAGSEVMSLDWRVPLSLARSCFGEERVLQGNLDPSALFASPDVLRSKVFSMLDQTRGRGHIVNLGHGLHPTTPISGIETFLHAVADWSEGRR